ncbi:23453_t:CDS:1, partial [Dentiscutata erythropus]
VSMDEVMKIDAMMMNLLELLAKDKHDIEDINNINEKKIGNLLVLNEEIIQGI